MVVCTALITTYNVTQLRYDAILAVDVKVDVCVNVTVDVIVVVAVVVVIGATMLIDLEFVGLWVQPTRRERGARARLRATSGRRGAGLARARVCGAGWRVRVGW